MIFLKCKIRFIYVGFNCKRKKSGVKNVWKFVPLRGGVGRLMANTILNFHFDYWNPSLSQQSSATGGERAFLDARAALSSKLPPLITDQLWKLGREQC